MGLLVYSPAVQLLVMTQSQGIIDVSQDISSGTVTLRENNPHSMDIFLINKRRRYDKIFSPNDRFVIYMKRISKLLIMTGYLNAVPLYSIFPRTIEITGNCGLKPLKYHVWDPGSAAAVQLMNATGLGPSAAQQVDNGVTSKLMALLTQVGGMDPTHIHIGALPTKWMTSVTTLYDAIAPSLEVGWATAGGGAVIAGSTPITSVQAVATRPDAPSGALLPSAFAAVVPYAGGFDIQKPTSAFYAQMRWGWKAPDGTPIANVDAGVAQRWLSARRLMVVDPVTNKAVIVEVTGWGPPAGSNGDIGLSPDAYSALSTVGSTLDFVQVAFIDSPADATITLGLYDNTTFNDPNYKQKVNPAKTGEPTAPNTNPGNPVATIQPSPLLNPADAIAYCQRQLKRRVAYALGGGRPIDGTDKSSYDCSSFVANAWYSVINANIGGDTISQTANTAGYLFGVTSATLQPGDLVYYGSPASHVAMYIGNGQVIQALNTVSDIVISTTSYAGSPTSYMRVVGTPISPSQQTAVANAGASVTGVGPGLIHLWDWVGQGEDPLSMALTGPRALMNDTPLVDYISMLFNASMRSYCSAPNSDLIGWFPDYFGTYKTLGAIKIADVELQNFTVMWDDAALVTHQFVAGSRTAPGSVQSSSPGGPVEFVERISTHGVVSVEMPEIMQALFNLGPGDLSGFGDPKRLLKRFGARPQFTSIGTIFGSVAEFWYALYLFKQNWANQFSALVPITFMPEAFPGMLLQIPSVGFQGYIEQVTHSFDLSDTGGGFRTDVNIIAPSAMDGSGLIGLVKGGVSI